MIFRGAVLILAAVLLSGCAHGAGPDTGSAQPGAPESNGNNAGATLELPMPSGPQGKALGAKYFEAAALCQAVESALPTGFAVAVRQPVGRPGAPSLSCHLQDAGVNTIAVDVLAAEGGDGRGQGPLLYSHAATAAEPIHGIGDRAAVDLTTQSPRLLVLHGNNFYRIEVRFGGIPGTIPASNDDILLAERRLAMAVV